MRTELQANYDLRASFYGKATVEYDNGDLILYSYNVKVCTITADKKVIYTDKAFFSKTTTRHIKEFLRQNGFKADTRKQMEKLANN